MFVETRYNTIQFEQRYSLPFMLHHVGVRRPQEKVHRPSGYFCNHVLWVTEGKGVFNINGKETVLSAGEGVFFRLGVPHSYYGLSNVFTTSYFTYTGADGLLEYYEVQDCFYFDVPSFLNNAINTLMISCHTNSNIIKRSGAGYALLTEFLDACFAPYVSLDQKVDQYLENNFSEILSLNDIAAAMDINKYTLCHLYSKASGVTIIEQLINIRISKAKSYLESTNIPVNKISKMCGFESSSYFGKIFREKTGYTPKKYRDSALQQIHHTKTEPLNIEPYP